MVISVGSLPGALSLRWDSGRILGSPGHQPGRIVVRDYEWAHLRPSEWRPGNRRLWLSPGWWRLKWTHTHRVWEKLDVLKVIITVREQSVTLSLETDLHGKQQPCRWRCGAAVTLLLTSEAQCESDRCVSFQWGAVRPLLMLVSSDQWRKWFYFSLSRKKDGHGNRHTA